MSQLITAVSSAKEVRIYIANTTALVEQARATHDLSPISCAALGRTLTGAVMMGLMSKIDEEKITLQIKGTGEVKLIVAVADTHGNVKGYISNPLAETHINDAGKLDVGGALGRSGEVVVIRDLGMKEPFIGRTELISGEIAEDIANYFYASEQMPSAVGLGVLLNPAGYVQQAGGFIVQLLPGASEETISQLEANLADVKSVTDLFEMGMSIQEIAGQILAGLGMEALETYPLQYQCDCSVDKMRRALLSIGQTELQTILEEDDQAELVCHFCNRKYLFSHDELTAMITSFD
ncbi:MAG: molecular chaperone Hsp33 [Clostridiales bacterium]|nr:molecular chaperone Hsp33 [Clostridiales bacterium]